MIFVSAGDERFVHRLEAFSDIVIAFALGQMSLNLVFPARAQDIYRHPTWLFAFFLTFTVICSIWYVHHKILDRYFEPRPVLIGLNFAVLAFTLLLAYMLQLFVHFSGSSPHDAEVGAIGYFVVFGITWSLLGAMAALGTRACWSSLDVVDRRWGVRTAVRNGAIGLGMLTGVGSVLAIGGVIYSAVWFVALFAIASRLVLARVLPRIA